MFQDVAPGGGQGGRLGGERGGGEAVVVRHGRDCGTGRSAFRLAVKIQ
ncbi:hypothetical protein L547_0462 [Bordetella pertussis H918]|nr:hypothetical protein L547_0462 [Bordetella pertussis H918]